MSDWTSSLYVGTVGHTRLRPFTHSFEYRIYTLLLDLDELPTIARKLRLFGHNRFNLFGFADRDHGPRDGADLRRWIDRQLESAGIDLAGGSVKILSFPRLMGYSFDPLTIWYCFHADGTLRAVLHEVKNTFGEQHCYLVPIDGSPRHEFDKEFFVSPFMDMEATYSFAMNVPDDRLSVGITQSDDEGVLLRASMRASRLELSDRHLMRVFMSHPLLTIKIIAAIHWQGFRLWRKGAPYRRRPAPPAHPVTVVERSRALEIT